MKTLPRRTDLPVEVTWNLSDIYPSDEIWDD
jgi:oligoendopeptidase F